MKRQAVLFDLDGTICDSSHRQHFLTERPRNWSAFFDACADDLPHPHVQALFDMVACYDPVDELKQTVDIVICSGRPDSHRKQTEDWLDKYSFYHQHLLMRKTGDYRPDHIVKKEMLDLLRDTLHYQVLFAVDDRATVVAMWEQNNVPVFQVKDSTI